MDEIDWMIEDTYKNKEYDVTRSKINWLIQESFGDENQIELVGKSEVPEDQANIKQ